MLVQRPLLTARETEAREGLGNGLWETIAAREGRIWVEASLAVLPHHSPPSHRKFPAPRTCSPHPQNGIWGLPSPRSPEQKQGPVCPLVCASQQGVHGL